MGEPPPGRGRVGWIDASAGISGDMLLGACVDAGVDVAVLQRAVDGLHLPDPVRLTATRVHRGGLAATAVHVAAADPGGPRTVAAIRALLVAADLDETVRARALAVFGRLVEAEARVHGVAVEAAHLHEVGAADSLADVVGAVAGLHALGLDRLVLSPIGLGGGRVATAHGVLPVPGPAVLELLRAAGAPGHGGPVDVELATPTGVAVAVTLATAHGTLPPMRPETVGVGAGGRDLPDHPNVTRLVVGVPAGAAADLVVVAANVDDLDPRLWPPTLEALLAAGAADAWLTPILMKKGRPAHTVSALVAHDHVAAVERVLFTHTTTIGVRRHPVRRTVLDRAEQRVVVAGRTVRVKTARLDGVVVNAVPEYDDVAAAAAAAGVPPKAVLDAARAAAAELLGGG